MPLQQILPTWVALNAANSPSPSGIADVRTGDPIYAGGLSVGDYFDVTEAEAKKHTYSANGSLHAGRYRWVQVSPSANATYTVVNTVGFLATALLPELNIVTTFGAGVIAPRLVVFLNTVTPGNYCFVQELGIVNIFASAAITGVVQVQVVTPGYVNPVGAGTIPMGIALDSVATTGLTRVFLTAPAIQG